MADTQLYDWRLTNGEQVALRRIDFATWIALGMIPQAFVQIMFDSQKGADAARIAGMRAAERAQEDREGTAETLLFWGRMFAESIASHRVFANGKWYGEAELPELKMTGLSFVDDILAIGKWQMAGAVGINVELTNGGEVPFETVKNFRQPPGRGAIAAARRNVRKVRRKAK